MADEKQKAADEIDLTAEDEAILDRVWDDLDKKWKQEDGDGAREHD